MFRWRSVPQHLEIFDYPTLGTSVALFAENDSERLPKNCQTKPYAGNHETRNLSYSTACSARLLSAPVDARELKGRARVIDGDTLYVGRVKVRLNGIDAPERGQARSRAATRALQSLVAGKVFCAALTGTPPTTAMLARATLMDTTWRRRSLQRAMRSTVLDTLVGAIGNSRRLMLAGISGKLLTAETRRGPYCLKSAPHM